MAAEDRTPARGASEQREDAPKRVRRPPARPVPEHPDRPEAQAHDADQAETQKTARKPTAKRSTAKKSTAKQAARASKRPVVKRATPKKTTGKKTAARKSPTKTGQAKTSQAKTSQAKTSQAKTSQAKARRAPDAVVLNATVALRRPQLPDPSSIPRPWLRFYPPSVPDTYEYPLVPLTRLLDDAAQDFPETPAIRFLGLELSYRKLLDQVDRFASALQWLGLGRGDRIGLVLPNCPQHIIAMFAALRIGATIVEADPREDTEELGRRLAETGVRAIVFLDPVYEKLDQLRGRLRTVEHLIGTGLQDYLPLPKSLLFPITGRLDGSYARIPSSEGVLRLTDLIKRAAPVFVQVEINPAHDLAAILYTSGGKGVMLTHLNLVANAFQGRLWLPDIQAGRERILCVVPFSHAFGLTACMTIGMLSAGTFVLVPSSDREGVLRTIEEQRPTLFPGLASMCKELVDGQDVSRYDLSSLRICLSGGAALPPVVAAQFENLTGGRLRETYGLTEAGSLTHANPVYGRAKPGSIGLPLTDTVCAVVDQHDPTRLMRPGQPGELAIHGPQVMKGYWNPPSDTASVLRDGWLLTGDIVQVDEGGYFHLVDQKRDVINAGGREVVPREVEAVLAGHPKVAKAAVAGIPELPGGELVKAYIVLEEGETATSDEIDAFCRQQLAAHEVPQRYEFRAFLPQTTPGRAMRDALVAEELGRG